MLSNLLAAQLYSAPVNFLTDVLRDISTGDVGDAPAVRDIRSAPRRVKLTSVSAWWTELQTSVRIRKHFLRAHVLAIQILSVRLSVRHTLVLYQNASA